MNVMITELMLLLIAVGVGIVVVAWSNTHRRKQDARERLEVAESTGKLKKELERTANEIIGRMENHVTHLESVLDESERNRTQLEGRVVELKKLLKKTEGQSGEIRDLLARLDDASAEVNSMQRKMDNIERKINLAMTTPLPVQQPMQAMQPVQPIQPIQQPVQMSQMTQMSPLVAQMVPQPVAPPKVSVTQVTTPPAAPMNPLGALTMPTLRPTPTPPKVEPKPAPPKIEPAQDIKPPAFDKVLEESIAEPKPEQPRSSIVLSPAKKQPMKVIDADPVKIEATRKKLTEVSAKLAETPPESDERKQPSPKRTPTRPRDVRRAAVDAINAAQTSKPTTSKPAPKQPVKPTQKIPPRTKPEILPERRDLRLETTDAAAIREMLISGKSIEDISRETGLGRGAIELIQEMTRRQLNRR